MRKVGDIIHIPRDVYSAVSKSRLYASINSQVRVVSTSPAVDGSQVLIVEREDGYRFPYHEGGNQVKAPPIQKEKVDPKPRKAKSAPVHRKEQSSLF